MPGGDGTGPAGLGAGIGWGRGPCGAGLRRGRAYRRSGRGFGQVFVQPDEKTYLEQRLQSLELEEKDLQQEKDQLRKRIEGMTHG